MRLRLDYPTVASTLALVVAMSGTAYAAATVSGADVVNGSLTGKDVKNNTLKSVDVAGLTSADFAANGMPGARMEASGALSVPLGADNSFEMDTQAFDTGNMYSAPNDFMTIRRTGTYLVTAYIAWADSASGVRQLRVLVNGAIVHSEDHTASTEVVQSTSQLLRLTAGDVLNMGTITSAVPTSCWTSSEGTTRGCRRRWSAPDGDWVGPSTPPYP
jgi:hypothetical protein